METVSNVKYSDLNTDRSEPSKRIRSRIQVLQLRTAPCTATCHACFPRREAPAVRRSYQWHGRRRAEQSSSMCSWGLPEDEDAAAAQHAPRSVPHQSDQTQKVQKRRDIGDSEWNMKWHKRHLANKSIQIVQCYYPERKTQLQVII